MCTCSVTVRDWYHVHVVQPSPAAAAGTDPVPRELPPVRRRGRVQVQFTDMGKAPARASRNVRESKARAAKKEAPANPDAVDVSEERAIFLKDKGYRCSNRAQGCVCVMGTVFR